MLDVALLGTGGTLPLPERFLSAALVRFGGQLILIDCGEGTQVSLRKLGWGLRDISCILITHFHADHISGLPGLLLTIGNSERGHNEPLSIIGPRGLPRIVEGLRVIAPHLPYPVNYIELSGSPEEQVDIGELQLRACPCDHDIACLAYRFDLPRQPEFMPEKARELGVPLPLWRLLQKGQTVEAEGKTFRPEDVLGPPRPGLSLGFVTDTRPTAKLVNFFQEVDLLISEGTYGDPADRPKAIENKHMTFTEATTMAVAAKAKRLWLTHFSPSMPNPRYFRKEAESIFPEVVIGYEHHNDTLKFRE